MNDKAMTDQTALQALRCRYKDHTPGLLGARRSFAVLCPLVETEEGLSLLFEVRAKNLRQGGEVCFPGGQMEPGETVADCALRETEEELSISPSTVTLLGTPDFICNLKGFLLRPVLGQISPEGFSMLQPSPAEVAEVFTAPLSFFRETPPELYHYDLLPRNPENFPYEEVGVTRQYPWGQGRVDLPIWHYGSHVIWGMTGRLVRDLIRY